MSFKDHPFLSCNMKPPNVLFILQERLRFVSVLLRHPQPLPFHLPKHTLCCFHPHPPFFPYLAHPLFFFFTSLFHTSFSLMSKLQLPSILPYFPLKIYKKYIILLWPYNTVICINVQYSHCHYYYYFFLFGKRVGIFYI